MLGFLLTTLIFIGALVGFSKMMDFQAIKKDWPKYRCRPDVMLMADFYGHNSTENLEFCLKGGFDVQASGIIAPFYTYLKSFVEILLTLLQSINSIRMVFATIVGSVTKVFSEFSGRIQALFYRIQMTAIRMKFLMSRVFAMMYAVMFMGMSGIKAGQNFSNTFLFRFLDTFCFPPWTVLKMKDGTAKMIRDIRIGDVLEDGDTVTATFQFAANGQDMVAFPGGVKVSTNHYVLHEGTWIKAVDHPDTIEIGPWGGGTNHPLICLNTDTHRFKVGGWTFRDYDETSEGDAAAMRKAETILNGKPATSKIVNSDMACSPLTSIKMKDGRSVPASQLVLGDELSHGRVIGIVKKEIKEYCIVDGISFAAGTLLWKDTCWKRAADIAESIPLESFPSIFYSFVVSPSATLETSTGLIFRDYVEVHSPDMESSYSAALAKECLN
jgi:hypothetical protein